MTELARLDGYLKKEKNPHSNDCQFSTLFLSVVASQHWLSKGSFLSSVCEKTLTQSCSMSGIDTFKIKKKKRKEKRGGWLVIVQVQKCFSASWKLGTIQCLKYLQNLNDDAKMICQKCIPLKDMYFKKIIKLRFKAVKKQKKQKTKIPAV